MTSREEQRCLTVYLLVMVLFCWVTSVEVAKDDLQIGDFDFADKSAVAPHAGDDVIEPRDQPFQGDDSSGEDEEADVDEGSAAIFTTRAPATPTHRPDGVDASGDTVSTKPCLEAQQKARARPGLIGGYVPQCDEHGEYKPLQSHGSTGHSWCVDRMGFEISGSRAPPGRPTPTCYVVEPTVSAVTACTESQFKCFDNSCIDEALRCDKHPDCADASDEVECDDSDSTGRISCGRNEFACESGSQCIASHLACNNEYDCDDASDESDCNGRSPTSDDHCTDSQFKCVDRTCVDIAERCDGYVQCPDGSDELECDEEREHCSSDEFACRSGNCIPSYQRCNRENNCGDNSDETGCDPFATTCYPTEFRCFDSNCIDRSLVCDRHRDCRDGSDELDCDQELCTAGQFTCHDGSCVDIRRQCDGYTDCSDGSDERGCVERCSADQFTCADGTCVDVGQHCDGHFDCHDGSDEQNCPDRPTMCEFTCGDGTCIQSVLHCDGKRDCRDGSDELHCAVPSDVPASRQCSRHEFRCDDGTCVATSRRCDQRYDCPDRTDEYYCDDAAATEPPTDRPTCEYYEFTCGSGDCVDSRRRCDQHYDCTDGSDEDGCAGPTEVPTVCAHYEFTCGNGECIDSRKRCDRSNDCRDGSDEHGCATPAVTISASPSQLRVREGADITFLCRFDVQPPASERLQLRWTRLSGAMSRQATDVNGRLHISQAIEADSGTYLCTVDNSRTTIEPARVSVIVDARFGPTLSPPRPGHCEREQASCANGVCIPIDYLCDGDYDCTDRSDEANCVSRVPCEPNEFQCANGKCIVKIWQCDGDDDCGGDKSDEQNCGIAPPNADCRADEYMCSSGRQCILKSYHCDGEVDCQDRSDEVGCTQPNVVRPPPGELMVQEGGTIVIECEAIGVPPPLIIWRLNWGHIGSPPRTSTTVEVIEERFGVPVKARGVLTIRNARNEDEGAYTCEAMNAKGSILAVPDTIVHVLNGASDRPPEIRCGPSQFTCGSGECIDSRRRCDRRFDCNDRSDETDCAKPTCSYYQFTCNDGSCIDESRRCDRRSDCRDGSDEQRCNNPPSSGHNSCDLRGSESQYQDPATRSCTCKDHTTGPTCSECRPNTFHLSELNAHGCTSCFCMGHTTSCTSSTYNRSQVVAAFTTRDTQGFTAVDSGDQPSDINADSRTRQLVLRSPTPRRELFWVLPEKFRGNKLTSYGGNLTYTVKYTPGSNRNPTRYADVTISGSDIELVYRHRETVHANIPTTISVPLHERFWQRPDGSPATREHFMMLLADIQSIKIRAIYSEDTTETSLGEVKLDSAESRNTGRERAYAVEQCLCPRGYKGLSCEECEVGFKRSEGGSYLDTCMPCSCNGHSSQCENGVCKQCQHNTAGKYCDLCAPGYYGDATRGSPHDCQPCPCPLASRDNQFSSSCRLDSDGQVTCLSCRQGYTGRNCERCDDGYAGHPRQPGGSCEPSSDEGQGLRVVIQNGREKRVEVGSTVRFYCHGISRHVYTVVWSRADGQLMSSRVVDDGQGTLTIQGAQPEDAGTYQCTGSDFEFGQATDNAELIVSGEHARPPVVRIDPDYLTIDADDIIELRCTATGFPNPRVEWVRGPHGPLPREYQDEKGVLRLRATKQDQGEYECRGTNSVGAHLMTSYVVVQGGHLEQPPVAHIDPDYLTVNVNDMVQLRCTATGFPEPRVEWVRGPSGPISNDAQFDNGLLQFRARKDDQGTYECRGSNSVGSHLATTYVVVQGEGYQPPRVRIEPDYLVARVDEVVELQCSASGYPEPDIEWTQGPHGTLPPDAVVHNGLLRLRITGKQQEGSYECRASNSAGSDRGSSYVVVEGSAEEPEFDVVIDQPTVSVRPGEDAQFECTARSRIAVETFNWTRYGDRLPPGAYQEGGRLVIPECRPSYSGQYVCTIYMVSGDQKVAYASLVVEDLHQERQPEEPLVRVASGLERQTIREGSTITLRCEVTGYPTPTVQWSKSGQPLGPRFQVEGNALRILHATVEDHGVYMCEAHNSQGSAFASFFIEIERHEGPVINIYPGTVQDLKAGDNALIQCNVVSGTPQPTLTWSRAHSEPFGDNTDVDHEGGMLHVNGITESEQGDYICTASNDAGTTTAIATLRVEGAPRLVLKPAGQQHVEAGGSLTLECAAEGEPGSHVEFHPPIGVDEPAVSGVGSAVLYISRVTDRHSGTYTCYATTHLGQSTRTIEVLVEERGSVYETVHVNIGPHELRVSVGQAAEFDCKATSSLHHQPTVRWSKVNGLLPPGHSVRDGVLRIHRVREEDAGLYRCTAEGEHSTTHEQVQLFILAPPLVTVTEQSRRLRPGDPFRVQCTAVDRATGEPLHVEWARRERDLDLSPAASVYDGILEIVSVTAPDAGFYQCSARNDAGLKSEAYFELIIHAPPSAIVTPRISHQNIGGTTEFRCEVTGSPHPRITWSKENGLLPRGHSITAGGAVLTLYNIRQEDDGRYVCGVTNDAGSTQDFGTLRVAGGGETSPQIPDQYQTVQVGDRVEIDCTVTGSPRPTIQWIKVNGELSREASVEGAKLIIPQIVESDQGTYRCIAKSTSGTAYRQVFITVEAPPAIPVSRQSRTVSVGSRVQLTCQAKGNPPPYLVWSKRDGELPSEHNVENGLLIIPSLREEDFGEYICHARNKLGHAEAIIELLSGELVPYFEQNDQSYVSYPGIREAYRSFDIETSFKPQVSDGLIFYNGQLQDGSGDFVSLGLRDSRVEFRLDVGSGPAVIASEPITLDTWHKIRIKRDGRNATMYVGDAEFKGQAPGAFIGLDLTENLYVGSVPDYKKISRAVGYSQGFVGCLSRLVISGVPVNLGADGIEIKGVSDCPVCQSRQCKNGGTCLPAAVDGGFSCRCPRGYSGSACELVGERCSASSCSNGGKCIDLPSGNGYRCVCPVGLTGKHCEHGSRIHTPRFNSTSFISYPTIRDALTKVQFRLQFKATSLDDGILLYNGYDTMGTGDFISLSLKQEHVVFQFDTGSGPASIRSQNPIVANQWVTVVAERNVHDGSLVINDEVAIKGSASSNTGSTSGGTVGLNLKTALYVGGVDRSEIRVSSFVEVEVGFQGCISQLLVSESPLELITGAIASKNIEDCDDNDDRDGRTCRRSTCQNGGTCVDLTGGQFQCRCPLGFNGAACEHRAPISTDAEFAVEGSYIELPSHLIPRRNTSLSDVIALTVMTTEPNGLLLWQGLTSGRSKDYMALTVEDGFPVFRYELGSGPAIIAASIPVDDGQQHELSITRTGKIGSLQVDGNEIVNGESVGQSTGLDARGNIFIGGLPNGKQLISGKFPDAFVGCISDVFIQRIGPLNLTEHALRGVDVQPCDF